MTAAVPLVSIGLPACKTSHAGPMTFVDSWNSLIAWSAVGGRKRTRAHARAALRWACVPRLLPPDRSGLPREEPGIIMPIGRAHI